MAPTGSKPSLKVVDEGDAQPVQNSLDDEFDAAESLLDWFSFSREVNGGSVPAVPEREEVLADDDEDAEASE